MCNYHSHTRCLANIPTVPSQRGKNAPSIWPDKWDGSAMVQNSYHIVGTVFRELGRVSKGFEVVFDGVRQPHAMCHANANCENAIVSIPTTHTYVWSDTGTLQ